MARSWLLLVMYVRMFVRTGANESELYLCMDVWMYVCMYVCKYVCMYVCTRTCYSACSCWSATCGCLSATFSFSIILIPLQTTCLSIPAPAIQYAAAGQQHAVCLSATQVMCVFTYVCMHVCMHVCMYAFRVIMVTNKILEKQVGKS